MPGERQFGVAGMAVEFVGGDDAGGAGVALSAGGEVERHWRLAVFAENGPAVLPRHGHEIGDATDGGVVLEKIGIPFAFRSINEAALGDAAIIEHDAPLVGTRECVGAVDDDGARPAAPGRGDVEEVVAAVDLEKLRALAFEPSLIGAEDGVDVFDEDLVHAPGLDSGEIGVQLGNLDASIPVNQVGTTVVVEKQAVVTDRGRETRLFPRAALRIARAVDVGASAGVGERRGIEHAVVETQAAGPGTETVGVFAVFEAEGFVVGEGFIGVGGHTPVDQVLRLHDREARAHVHRRAAHVIGFSYTDHCDVRDVGPDKGIMGRILGQCRR